MENIKDNKIVYIDLTNNKVLQQEITPELRKKYIGGNGINTWLLYKSEAMLHDALSEKNVLIFGVGPAVGTGMIASNRCTVTAKGPINDMYADSNVGGDFNLRMRAVGIDHLVFTGKSDKPVYVHIDKAGEVSILDAAELWGTWSDKATDILTERHGARSEVACIGPAGENLVRFASVVVSKCHAAGRAGMGCVMGSKNLKAIVIDDKKGNPPPLYSKEKISEIKDAWLKACRTSVISKSGSIEGSLMLIKRYQKAKCIPIRNYQAADDDKIKDIYPDKFLYEYQTKRKACITCPVGCAREYEIKHGKYKGETGDRIDYGAVAGVGPNVGIFDWASILHLKMLSDYLGMDTIELGGAMGLILECQQRGIISKEDTGGRILEFGNADDVEHLMKLITYRQGIGDITAEGAYRAAEKLGAQQYAFCIKKAFAGLHLNSHLAKSLSYLTSTRGGDHLKAYVFTSIFGGLFSEIVSKHIFRRPAEKKFADPEDKGRIVWWHENYKNIVDALGLCMFVMQALPSTGNGLFDDFADIMNAIYNLDMKAEDIFYAGERIYQLQNAFSVQCGLQLNDYQWPERKKDADIDDKHIDANTIKVRDHAGMLPEYFKYRGLTSDGKPTVKRFAELDIAEYADKAEAIASEDTQSIQELLKEIKLFIKLAKGERIKSNMISSLLCKLLDKKDAREKAMYLKKKQAITNKQ